MAALTATTNATLPVPAKSILRKPTGSKRPSDEVRFGDDREVSPATAKRRKVEFNLENNTVMEVSKITIAQVTAEVKRALEDHANGNDERYDMLKERFADVPSYDILGEDADNPPDLRNYILALNSCVALFGRSRSCDGLLKAILGMRWLGRDNAFIGAYIRFLTSLLTRTPSLMREVFSMLVGKFTETRSESWTVLGYSEYPAISREEASDRVHAALKRFLECFPLSSKTLSSTINRMFPFLTDSKRVQLAYIKNLLRLRTYADRDLKEDAIDAIFDRLLKLDVQMQLDLDDIEDEEAARVMWAVKHAQDLDDQGIDGESDNESLSDDDEDRDEMAEKIFAMKCTVEKMDAILDTLFEAYAPAFQNPDSEEAFKCFESMMGQFSHFVLPTYKSRHTQFLYFLYAQKSERLIDAFCATCITYAFESSRPVVVRQTAVSYLAGFVARGVHVPGHIVRSVFDIVGQHVDGMREKHEASCKWPDLQKYGTFYSFFQALLYIFCFRWKDLVVSVPDGVEEDDTTSYFNRQDLIWANGVYQILNKGIYSKLNPLKVCAPSIVKVFAELALKLDFMYVDPKLDQNKRFRLAHFATSTYSAYGNGALRESRVDGADESAYQLDPYFPFDPYQLPTSKRWVESDYRQWEVLPDMGGEADEESSDDDNDDEMGRDDYEEGDVMSEDTATDDSEDEA